MQMMKISLLLAWGQFTITAAIALPGWSGGEPFGHQWQAPGRNDGKK
jgi:hypothetical protein